MGYNEDKILGVVNVKVNTLNINNRLTQYHLFQLSRIS